MAFIYHIKAIFNEQSLLTWMWKDKQIIIQTYIQTHAHFSENNFSKPGVHQQLAFGQLWVHAWFKKYELLHCTVLLMTLMGFYTCIYFIHPFMLASYYVHSGITLNVINLVFMHMKCNNNIYIQYPLTLKLLNDPNALRINSYSY